MTLLIWLNENLRFHQKDTLKRFFEIFEQNRLTINRFRADRGSCSEEIEGIEVELNSILGEKWKGKAYRLVVQRQKRMDGMQDLWEGEYTCRCILTNDYESSAREILEFNNLRGGNRETLPVLLYPCKPLQFALQ